MLKALIKKQFSEQASIYFRDKKSGKKRSGGAFTAFVILYIFIYVSVAASFFGMAMLFAHNLFPVGLDWLSFAILGLLGISLSVIVNSLTTFSMLYKSKDNELLLSMPIPPSKILLSRMIAVYAFGVLYESAVVLPAMIVYWINRPVTFGTVVIPVISFAVSSFLVLSLICIIGWIIAEVISRVKNKNIFTVVLSLGFIAGVYYVQFRINYYLQLIVSKADEIASIFREKVYPVYLMGLAYAGDKKSVLLFGAACIAFFAIVYAVLSSRFINIVTLNKGSKKVGGGASELKISERSLSSSLLRREFRHFVSSPAYMLNTGLGIIVFIVLSVLAVVKKADFNALMASVGYSLGDEVSLIPVIPPIIAGMVISLSCYTAPSISLEGKTLWVLRSLPVEPVEVFKAKEGMHLIMNIIPAEIFTVCIGAVLGESIAQLIASMLFAAAYPFLSGAFGLMINLLKPSFDWTNETTPIKQSVSVVAAIFGGWAVMVAFGAAAYGLNKLGISESAFGIFAFAVIFTVLGLLINKWLVKKGVEIFNNF